MAILVFLVCTLIPSIFAQCTIEKAEPFFSRSVYEFSINLVRRIGQDTEYHFVASTLSPWTLLAYTSLGATGSCLQELNTILRLHHHKCFNNKFFEITKSIYSPTAEKTLEGSSAIFVDERIRVYDEFQRQVKSAGVSEVKQISLDNYDYVAAYINNYVKSATNGAIEEVVISSDLDNVVMMIIDALRFKGIWQVPFPFEETEESSFYDEMNNKIGDVNLMFLNSDLNYIFVDQLNATVVELPYTDKRFSMLLFVPYEDSKLSNVLDSLKEISLKSLFIMLKQQNPQEIMLQLPRFKISSDLSNLKELLIDMGLKSIFDSNQAQFTKISDYPLYISNLIQKADVEVTEEGTVASAVTKAEFSFKSLPYRLTANKPFFFMIVDKKSVVPVFAGAYSKPSKY